MPRICDKRIIYAISEKEEMSEHQDTIVFETSECPPSTNTYYRNFRGHMVLSKKGREFKKTIAESCGKLKFTKIKGPIKVDLSIRFGDKRKRDLDNYFKAIFDALKDVLYEDDVMIEEIHATKQIGCKKDPGFTLEITPFPV